MKNKYINPEIIVCDIEFESIMDVSNPIKGDDLFAGMDDKLDF